MGTFTPPDRRRGMRHTAEQNKKLQRKINLKGEKAYDIKRIQVHYETLAA